MPPESQWARLLAASRLRIPARRLRALLYGGDDGLAQWIDTGETPAHAEARGYAQRTLAHIASFGARLVTMLDAEYPAGLRDLSDAPAFLIVQGILPMGGVAIIGSRTPPPEALAFAYELARRCGRAVVSGLAAGIDGSAHRGALAAGVPTIAYVAHGLGATFPAQHRGLEQSIIGAGGAIASERLPGERALAWALIKRDRLQAAHAHATVLIASEADGGALHTMRFAATLQRARFAIVPPYEQQGRSPWGGNLRALADGALALPFDLDEAVAILEQSFERAAGA